MTQLFDRKASCFGCGACQAVCPAGAIAMTWDADGFSYPVVDAAKCVHCGRCTAVCPMNIAIPQYFALYNRQDATSEEYSRLDCEFGKASDCIVCGQCEKICPQQLSIRKLLRDVAERFE